MDVSLKYLRQFWKTLEMPLINFEINLILNWLENCVNSEGNRVTTFAITDTKLYVPVGSLLTNDNANLLQQLIWGFKRTTYCNKYQSKVTLERQDQYLDYLIDTIFKGVNSFFYHLKIMQTEQDTQDIFSESTNKGLQYYDQWTKCFWSTSEKLCDYMISFEKLQ